MLIANGFLTRCAHIFTHDQRFLWDCKKQHTYSCSLFSVLQGRSLNPEALAPAPCPWLFDSKRGLGACHPSTQRITHSCTEDWHVQIICDVYAPPHTHKHICTHTNTHACTHTRAALLPQLLYTSHWTFGCRSNIITPPLIACPWYSH